MQKKQLFNSYIHYFIYLLASMLFTYSIDISMIDDGLRHISFANNLDEIKDWASVFPYSLFNEYDQWFGWHFLLEVLLLIVPVSKVHLIVNFLSLFLLMILSHKLIKEYVDYRLDSLTYILVFLLVTISFFRYVMVRPDLLSGLYIMMAILLKNRFSNIFILTLFYGPFYYLFFMYTGSIGLVYLIQQKYRAFLGLFLASTIVLVFYFIHDFSGYTNAVMDILNDQNIRMGLKVGEGLPIFGFLTNINYFIIIPVFLVISISLIYKYYTYFKSHTLATFLLVTSVLWFNQHRYYHLFIPLIFIFIFSIVMNSNKKRVFYKIRKYFVIVKRLLTFSKNKKTFYIIIIPYSMIFLAWFFGTNSLNSLIQKNMFYKNQIYNNKTILSNTMDVEMFSAIYYNPTVKLIPSCSIGWFKHQNEDYKILYVKMISDTGLTEEELGRLTKAVNADFYFHFMTKKNDIKLDFKKLIKYGIIAKEIQENKIIFEIKK